MTEETKVEETEKEEEVVVEVNDEPSPTEVTAREQGWVSEEEWVEQGKSADDWRPAKEFVDRGELYKSIHTTKRELKQTQAALSALQKHHQYVFEKAQKQAIDELKREKRVALRNEELDRVEAIEDEMEQLQEQQTKDREALIQTQQATVAQGPHPDFVAWQEKNSWYGDDQELREYADFKGIKYAQANPGSPPQEVLKYVEGQIKKQFPEKFGVRKAAPNAVKGVNKTNSASRKALDDYEMTETELDIMKELVSSKVMTKEKYIAELKKVKDR